MIQKSIIEMKLITKIFPGVTALDQVSLKAVGGEIIGLVGVNGAGKSTLMNILGGVYKANKGKILINAEEVVFNSPLDATLCGISFIHQELNYFASQSVAENIFMSDLPMHKKFPFILSQADLYKSAENILSLLGSNIDPRVPIEELSVGEKQVIEIARALAKGNNIVIFDEPSSSLSITEKNKLFETVIKLKQEGKIIIYISHFIEEILHLCDRYYVLRNGKMVGEGNVKEVSKNQIITLVIGKEILVKSKNYKYDEKQKFIKIKNSSQGNKLKNINFEINRGEILGIWGLMGSGRTELLRCLLGLDKKDSGEIIIAENKNLNSITPIELRQKCGFVTESRRIDGLFLNESVKKNITSANLKLYAEGIFKIINTNSELGDAESFINKLSIKTPSSLTKIENLSGGNQQKAIFAKWLNKKPQILILDEPTRGVDVGAKQEIASLIMNLANEGISVLLVSSELEEIVNMSDRVLVLRDGTICHEASGSEISEEILMATALGGN